MIDYNKVFAFNLKLVREAYQMTRNQLYKKSGILIGRIENIERGTANATLKEVCKLCAALDRDVKHMISYYAVVHFEFIPVSEQKEFLTEEEAS